MLMPLCTIPSESTIEYFTGGNPFSLAFCLVSSETILPAPSPPSVRFTRIPVPKSRRPYRVINSISFPNFDSAYECYKKHEYAHLKEIEVWEHNKKQVVVELLWNYFLNCFEVAS